MPVSLPGSNFYARWLANRAPIAFEENEGRPAERLLQAVWHHQRLLRDALRLADGRTLRVLHPGFWNREAGPDFRGAILQIDGEMKTGDIEVDLVPGGWHGHGHDRNPNFKNVILHVVWETSGAEGALPTLCLKPVLDAPLDDLSRWLDSDAGQSWPRELSGNCCAPLRELKGEGLELLLKQAARIRLERKARELHVRARQAGWEQALWEGLFRALGYKQNVWPMRRLAELIPDLRNDPASPQHWQARLLGVSGLLPRQLESRPVETRQCLRQLWDIWWREQEKFTAVLLPRSLWKMNGLRPANHPQRRLALAAHWLSNETLIPALEKWFLTETGAKQAALDLLKLIQVNDDPFWTRHWTLNSATMTQPQPLLGAARTTDLAVNVLLPWFWMRADSGQNASLKTRAEQLYFEWPAAEDNAVLRLARRRLLGSGKTKLLASAAAQQGLMQIVRDFCEHSNALCAECQFPDLIRQWRTEIGPPPPAN